MPRRAKAITEMPTEFLRCRAIVHPWDPKVTYIVTYNGRKVYETHLQCLSCKGWRIDAVYASTGERLPGSDGRRYADSDESVPGEEREGYYLAKGVAKKLGGRVVFTRKMRAEVFSRFVVSNGGKRRGR